MVVHAAPFRCIRGTLGFRRMVNAIGISVQSAAGISTLRRLSERSTASGMMDLCQLNGRIVAWTANMVLANRALQSKRTTLNRLTSRSMRHLTTKPKGLMLTKCARETEFSAKNSVSTDSAMMGRGISESSYTSPVRNCAFQVFRCAPPIVGTAPCGCPSSIIGISHGTAQGLSPTDPQNNPQFLPRINAMFPDAEYRHLYVR